MYNAKCSTCGKLSPHEFFLEYIEAHMRPCPACAEPIARAEAERAARAQAEGVKAYCYAPKFFLTLPAPGVEEVPGPSGGTLGVYRVHNIPRCRVTWCETRVGGTYLSDDEKSYRDALYDEKHSGVILSKDAEMFYVLEGDSIVAVMRNKVKTVEHPDCN